MPIRANGSWYPSISKKQASVIFDKHKFLLVSGPKQAGKSWAALAALANHLWETPGAKILFLGKTISELYDNGLWTHFINQTLTEWIDAGFGMEWVMKDRMRHTTHKQYLQVTNKHGGISEAQLDSLEFERDVEDRYKGKEYTCIYMPELSKHKERHVFDLLSDCLRGLDIPQDQYRFIGDTNPADEGTDSWIYKLWYNDRVADWSKIEDPIEQLRVKTFQPHLGLIEFTLEDNIFLSPDQLLMQKARWSHSKDLYDRFVLGKWVKASTQGFYSEVWRPNYHIVGEPYPESDQEPEILMPSTNCYELHTGWDYGPRNPSIHVIEKVPNAKAGKSVFLVLDEFVRIGQQTKLSEVVEEVLAMMAFWEQQVGKKLRWRHRSDQSAFNIYIGAADTFEAKEVFIFSDGEISLEGNIKKGPGSVMKRAELLRKLLHEDRLFVSRKCPAAIEMFNAIRTGRTGRFDGANPMKHVLDSISYEIAEECWSEIDDDISLVIGKATDRSGVVIGAL